MRDWPKLADLLASLGSADRIAKRFRKAGLKGGRGCGDVLERYLDGAGLKYAVVTDDGIVVWHPQRRWWRRCQRCPMPENVAEFFRKFDAGVWTDLLG